MVKIVFLSFFFFLFNESEMGLRFHNFCIKGEHDLVVFILYEIKKNIIVTILFNLFIKGIYLYNYFNY